MLALFRPRRAGIDGNPMSVAAALGLHVMGLVCGGLAVLLLYGLEQFVGASYGMGEALIDGVAELFEEASLFWTPWIMLIVLLAVELAFVGGAWLVSAWGAADERWFDSVIRAVKRVWMITATLAIILLLTSLPTALARGASQRVDENHPSYPSRPVAWGTHLTPEQQAQWDEQLAAYHRQVNEWQQSRPWYEKHRGDIETVCYFVWLGWTVWVILACVGAPPISTWRKLDKPPTCEGCGYDLSMTAMDRNCPECGLAVSASLGKTVRPGSPWQNRGTYRRAVALMRTWLWAAVQPVRLGKSIPLSDPSLHHRWVLGVAMLVATGLTWAGVLLVVTVNREWNEKLDLLEAAIRPAVMLGVIFATLTLLGSIAIASLVGTVQGWLMGRNLLHPAMQAAACATGLLLLWQIVFWLNVLFAKALEEWDLLNHLSQQTQWTVVLVLVAFWSVVHLLMLVWYMAVIGLAARAGRWANR